MIRKIEIPFHLKFGTKKMVKGFPKDVNIIAMDTETVKGEPYTIQLATESSCEIFFVNKENVTEVFLNEVRKLVKPKTYNIIYGHNLQFDLSILFYPFQHLFVKDRFQVKIGDIFIIVYAGKLFFAEIHFGDIKVLLYDTFRFVLTSLDKACKDLELPIRKLPTPEGLGDKKLRSKEFKEYALNDARIQYILSSWIVDRCKDVDIPIPISVAQYAQYVFRKKFLTSERSMTFPPMDCVNMSLLSYHGGRNGCYIDTPALIQDVSSYDIVSAYPYAMSELPSFIGGQYKRVEKFSDKYVGVYQVSGKYNKCHYGLLYDHKFNRIETDRIDNICLTSYEILNALKHKELKINSLEGYIFIPDELTDNPLKAYIDHFFEIKQTAKDLTQKWIAKICLNSLYGKFIQTNQSQTVEKLIIDMDKKLIRIEDVVYMAGGMFNPFIATLITSHTRTYCHDLEHCYNALHTATDSIFTRDTDIKTSSELGGLKYEGSGDLLLLRNKLYVHWNGPYKNEEIRKYALHGFHAKINDLLSLWKDRKKDYNYKKMTLIKESIIQKNMSRKANIFNEYNSTLDINWNKYYEKEN